MIARDVGEMTAAIVGAFPDLAGRPLIVHDGGWDSLAIEVDGWLCKFPRDADGPDALRREAALLRVVRPTLSIKVPDMAVIEGPPLFTRHRILEGTPVLASDWHGWSAVRRAVLAGDIARFLAELHAVDHDWTALGIEAEEDDAEIGDAAALALLAPALRPAAERVIADHLALGADPLGEGLCYLDAHGRNFAFDEGAGRLTGIYDFGDAAIAPRHEEFIEPAYVGRDCARRVIAAYEGLTGRDVDRRRLELLIGRQRLNELADDADHPRHGAMVRALAHDWFRAPTLDAPDLP